MSVVLLIVVPSAVLFVAMYALDAAMKRGDW